MSDWLAPAEGKPEPEPETDERPNEESIVLGLYVQGGMPLNMAGPLLKAIGTMYPASMWTSSAEDLAKVPSGASFALRIPLADIHGFAEDDEDDDDQVIETWWQVAEREGRAAGWWTDDQDLKTFKQVAIEKLARG